MTVEGMFGLHSDWHRTFTISDGANTSSIELFPDTGWWRGSHLFLHGSGTYVLHEGQLGCTRFALEPLTFDPPERILCAKTSQSDTDVEAAQDRLNGYPKSRFYEGLYYIGRFIEAHASGSDNTDAPLVFQTHEHHPETELPARL
ncbi:hypothetical protein [Marivita hallyeonensis]|nr:hypothetical protein [Marivita hallyeonensis]